MANQRLHELLQSHSTRVQDYNRVCQSLLNGNDVIEGRFFNTANRFPNHTSHIISGLLTKLDSEKGDFNICAQAASINEVYGALEDLVHGLGHNAQPASAEPMIVKLARKLGIHG